jgi:hypothetical protein
MDVKMDDTERGENNEDETMTRIQANTASADATTAFAHRVTDMEIEEVFSDGISSMVLQEAENAPPIETIIRLVELDRTSPNPGRY